MRYTYRGIAYTGLLVVDKCGSELTTAGSIEVPNVYHFHGGVVIY